MSATHFIFIDNTGTVELNGLSSALDDSFINDAAVSMTLKDSAGAEVAGESWPLPLIYVEGSTGNYAASFSHEVALEDQALYTATITATLGDGSRGEWVEPLKAVTRSRETQLLKWWPK